MNKRWRGRIVILTVLLLAAMALVAIPASADSHLDGEEVKTTGRVGGGDGGDFGILCKWELPDASRTPGMQYGGELGRYKADYPCSVGEDDLFPSYEGGQTVLGIEAWPHNLSNDRVPDRRIELWSAVDPGPAATVGGVHWKIYHPDGSFKWQAHGVRVPRGELDRGLRWDGANNRYQIDMTQKDSMWYAASAGTRQIEEDAVEAENGLAALGIERGLGIYRSAFPLHKDQPCGRYDVVNYLVVNDAETSVTNHIYVHCFIDLQLDFDGINWGLLTGGGVQILTGNTAWDDFVLNEDGDRGSRNMTVGNGGSGQMQVGLAFAPLVEDDKDGPKLITWFDAAFGRSPSTIQTIPRIDSSDEPKELGRPAFFNRVLCANETGKLDLSVHPPRGIAPGTYDGHMVVLGRGALGNNDSEVVTTTTPETPPKEFICNNDNGIWDDGNQRPSRPPVVTED